MCDIDKFKSVNDTYGHQAGDAVLKQFADVLKHEAREIDRVGRYGGEEFIVLLPGTVLDAAVTFAERVRSAVEARTFTFDGGTLLRTVSCGVAAFPHPGVSAHEALIKAADSALYVAKETGRNRVIRYASREFNEHTQPDDKSEGNPAVPGGAVNPDWGDRPAGGSGLGAATRA
jgi:diguanylate cyclase (GGDEF)-like protein